MSRLLTFLASVLCTIVMFVGTIAINEWLFRFLEFEAGINWVYLPAGIRLISMLIFAEAGAVGLLLASWGVSFLIFFPGNFERAFMGGIVATAAPYLVYKLARHSYGLDASLSNLTPRRLLACVVAYSFSSPVLHHIYFLIESHGDLSVLSGLLPMIVGDLIGTLVVVYALKFAVDRFGPRR